MSPPPHTPPRQTLVPFPPPLFPSSPTDEDRAYESIDAAAARAAAAAAEVTVARRLRSPESPPPPPDVPPPYAAIARPPIVDDPAFFKALAERAAVAAAAAAGEGGEGGDDATATATAGLDPAFFAFHYLPGARAQHAAALALHASGWRLHTRYGRWFRWPPGASVEGRTLTDTFDKGPFIYWETESWAPVPLTTAFNFTHLHVPEGAEGGRAAAAAR